MPDWTNRFFSGLYAEVLDQQFDPARSLREARLVKRLLRARRGQKVLDVPCGMGRLTIPLARMGLDMTGVDITPRFIRKAGRLSRREGLDVRYLVEDMRRIDFDGAFNWFTSIGYDSDADDLEFCRRVFRALKPGGRFLIETLNKSWVLAHQRKDAVERTIGGVRIIDRGKWDARAGRIRAQWTFIEGRKRERHTMLLRQFNGTDIRRLLREAGFRETTLFGNPPLGRFTRHSRRLLALARRPR